MTTVTLPRLIDSWCEGTLNPAEGSWQASAGFVDVDTSVSAVGASSIKIWSNVYNYYVSANFSMLPSVNTTIYSNWALHFLVALQANSGMSGTGMVVLYDSAGRSAHINFSCNTSGVWESKDIPLSQFVAVQNFDWTRVITVRIIADQTNKGGACWIDQLYFSVDVPDSILLMQSQPTGKTGVYQDWFMCPTSFITPSQLSRPVNMTGIIQMEVQDFSHWADQPTNINPTRSFKFPSTNTILQAIYAVPPPDQNPLFVIDSFDQNMDAVSGVSAVKLVFSGIPQFVNVPFGGRVSKGSWSFTAVDTAKRKFKHWKMPNGSINTSPSITFDIQSDCRFEVHWQSSETPPGEDGEEIPWALIVGIVSTGLVVAVGLFLYSKKKKK